MHHSCCQIQVTPKPNMNSNGKQFKLHVEDQLISFLLHKFYRMTKCSEHFIDKLHATRKTSTRPQSTISQTIITITNKASTRPQTIAVNYIKLQSTLEPD